MQIPPNPIPNAAGATAKRPAVASPNVLPLLPYMPGLRASLLVLALISAAMASLIMFQNHSAPTPAHAGDETASPTATPRPIPTLTPTATPAGVDSVWGLPAYSFTTQLSAGQLFTASNITPDGKALLGNLVIPNVSGTASVTPALLTLATHMATPMGMPPGTQTSAPVCCLTDGRYAVAADPLPGNAACAYCATQLWIADLTTESLHSVTVGSVSGVWLSQGRLLVQEASGNLSVIVLATRMTSAVTTGGSGLTVLGFSWPLAIARDVGGSAHLLDLAANTENILPQAVGLTSAAFDGSTLIAGVPDVAANGTEIVSFANSSAANPAMTVIGIFPDPDARVQSANDQAIAFTSTQPLVWDRAAGTLVALSTQPGATVTTTLADTFLLVISASATGSLTEPEQISVYNTASTS